MVNLKLCFIMQAIDTNAEPGEPERKDHLSGNGNNNPHLHGLGICLCVYSTNMTLSNMSLFIGHEMRDGSTMGCLQSVGSDLTRTRELPEPQQNLSMQSEQGASTVDKGPKQDSNKRARGITET